MVEWWRTPAFTRIGKFFRGLPWPEISLFSLTGTEKPFKIRTSLQGVWESIRKMLWVLEYEKFQRMSMGT